jgi:voltage-gated potassium channel
VTTSVARVDAARLETIPLFAGLTLDQRSTVAEACAELTVDAGTSLVREGDFGHGAFAIVSGTADVVHDDVVLRSLGPGDMFGEIAVLSGGRRTASVVATTDMTLISVLNRDLWRIERDCPEIADALRETIAERLGEPAAGPAS